ncbi:hypothetical protein E3N88_06118 [Mikania micrantha]|uniref:Secreted protein n=1 Tax=Mikania micrantha TaxID=192012 RepID=A0A5N6PNQ3_9ASTR|nr:hypothetical protein E3N88_06118 [Mikania micrantha]
MKFQPNMFVLFCITLCKLVLECNRYYNSISFAVYNCEFAGTWGAYCLFDADLAQRHYRRPGMVCQRFPHASNLFSYCQASYGMLDLKELSLVMAKLLGFKEFTRWNTIAALAWVAITSLPQETI